MYVELGITERVDATRDSEGKLHYGKTKGEFTTYFSFPEGHSVYEAAQDVMGGLPSHMASGKPEWVESDNQSLKQMICTQLRVDQNKRKTAAWGGS